MHPNGYGINYLPHDQRQWVEENLPTATWAVEGYMYYDVEVGDRLTYRNNSLTRLRGPATPLAQGGGLDANALNGGTLVVVSKLKLSDDVWWCVFACDNGI